MAGTSCSSPTFAAFVSLLNDARIANDLPALGFLNPLIYAIGALNESVFNDITVGNNPGCGTEGFNVSAGLYLLSGYPLDKPSNAGHGGVGRCDWVGNT